MMRKHFEVFIFFGVLFLGFTGCGNQGAGESQTPQVKTETPIESATSLPLSQETGGLKGKISFVGTAPEAAVIQTGADPVCSSLAGGLKSEELVVTSGALQNVFVYIKTGLEGRTFPVPAEPVMLNQSGCHYVPHVAGVQVNQALRIMNSDTTLHNVHAMAKASKEFNLGMPLQGMKMDKKFTAQEVMVHFKCDVHPWMSAYLGVLTHPFFAVSAADGSFEIKNIPAGQYTLAFWHEKLGEKEVQVQVLANQDTSADISFS